MSPWKCAGCHCEYQWINPSEKNGLKFCDSCVDDPDRVNQAARSNSTPIHAGWWFALGILIGMVLTKLLFVNN